MRSPPPNVVVTPVARRRRSFRFGLRSLLAIVALLALAAIWYGNDLRAREQLRHAAGRIEAKGGSVWYDKVNGTVQVDFSDPKQSYLGCGQIGPVECVEYPANGPFTDGDLSLLDDLRRLTFVDFRGSEVTASAVEQFRSAHPGCEVHR